jgi:hypothetical protein
LSSILPAQSSSLSSSPTPPLTPFLPSHQVGWLTAPLSRALVRMYWPTLVLTGVLKLATSLVQFAPPMIISRLLKVLEAGSALDVRRGEQEWKHTCSNLCRPVPRGTGPVVLSL